MKKSPLTGEVSHLIYLLEDDDSIRKLVIYALESQGYQAEGFEAPSAFWSAMKRVTPELVLLDIMLPEEDGLSVLRRLRAAGATRKLPVIMLTAKNTEYDRVIGLDNGADDFISKPFNKEELITRVYHQISLVAANRTIVRQNIELQQTVEGRDQLYSVISHDLRSPIGSIKMVLNMLILNLPAEKIGPDMFELLTTANQTTEDVFALLDNLLKWTKSQLGRMNVVIQDFDVVEILNGVIEVFAMVASVKKIPIRYEGADRLLVTADMDMVKTVVRNLISNAIKFSTEGKEIVLRAVQKGSEVEVSVEDHGCGISEEGQKKLLQSDSHFSTFGTKNEEGSGLGLLLCNDFVQKNNGRLWFTSKEGVGSTFFFSLPAAK